MASTPHTFQTKQNGPTNSRQLQQGHQQNLSGLTKVTISLRGDCPLPPLLYKTDIVHSYQTAVAITRAWW